MRYDSGKYDIQEFSMFSALKTHALEICDNNQEQLDRILLSAKAVKEYSGSNMTEEMISSFFAKVCC
jgi:hypothetical protein